MGQSQGKERAEGGATVAGGSGGGNSHIKSFDGGAMVPQGVYSGPQDYDHQVVRNLILQRKLSPFYKGLDDEDAYAEAPYNSECPICFLHYPSPLNHTRCCGQPICTECFVQIKRADPNHTNPPSSEPAACPYCQESEFGIVYQAPPPGVLNGEVRNVAGTAESATAAREQAEESAEGAHIQSKRRKSFRADDPSVITTDIIRPDWQAKLQAAEATLTRRANRRIIMRQVGERLIPVGVSSSRMGAELPPGSTTGPGGAIIISENTRWPGSLSSGAGLGGERRGSRSRRSEFAQFLQTLGGGPDMEEVMMMEAMRLSLIEHEEQQRRQAQEEAEQRQREQEEQRNTATTDSVATRDLPGQGAAPSSHAEGANGPGATLPRSSSLGGDALPPAALRGADPSTAQVAATPTNATSVPPNAAQLGLSTSMMAELSELVDGGLAGVGSRSTMPDAASSSALRVQQHSTTLPASGSASPTSAAQAFTPPPTLPASPSLGASTPPAVGSPSRLRSNPNNPFRARMAAAQSTGAEHSGGNGEGDGSSLF